MLRPVDLQCHSDSQADVIELQHPLHYFLPLLLVVVLLRSAGIREKEKGHQVIHFLLPVNFIFSALALSAVIWLSWSISNPVGFGVTNVLIVNYPFRLSFRDACSAFRELGLETQILNKCPRSAVVSEEQVWLSEANGPSWLCASVSCTALDPESHFGAGSSSSFHQCHC